jgi:hypothetical protein
MPTHYEYAVMSQQAYYDGETKDINGSTPSAGGLFQTGWNNWFIEECYYPSNERGLGLVLYRNDQDKEFVLAFRGTDPNFCIKTTLFNILTDLGLASNHMPDIVGFALIKVKELINNIKLKYPDYDIFSTGHSQGAVLAEITACKFKLGAVTFESPGCKHIVDNDPDCQANITDPVDSYIPYEKITCYLSAPNAINTYKPHIGKLIRIYIDHVKEGYTSWNFRLSCLTGTIGRGLQFANIGATFLRAGTFAYTLRGSLQVAPVILPTASATLSETSEYIASKMNNGIPKNIIQTIGNASGNIAAVATVYYGAKNITDLAKKLPEKVSRLPQLVKNSKDAVQALPNLIKQTPSIVDQVIKGQYPNLKELSHFPGFKESWNLSQLYVKEMHDFIHNSPGVAEAAARVEKAGKAMEAGRIPGTLIVPDDLWRESMEASSIYESIYKAAQEAFDKSDRAIQLKEKIATYQSMYHISSGSVTIYTLQEIQQLADYGIAYQPVASAKWLLSQHSIGNIVDQFDPQTGAVKLDPRTQTPRCSSILSWPNLYKNTLFASVKNFARTSVPFHPANKGLHTLFFSTENKVIENQIKCIPGYMVSNYHP